MKDDLTSPEPAQKYPVCLAIVIGIATGALFNLIWMVFPALLGGPAVILVPALSGAVAAAMTAYKRESSTERIAAIGVAMAFIGLFLVLILAKKGGAVGVRGMLMGQGKVDIYTYVDTHKMLFSSIEIVFGSIFGAIFGKSEK